MGSRGGWGSGLRECPPPCAFGSGLPLYFAQATAPASPATSVVGGGGRTELWRSVRERAPSRRVEGVRVCRRRAKSWLGMGGTPRSGVKEEAEGRGSVSGMSNEQEVKVQT